MSRLFAGLDPLCDTGRLSRISFARVTQPKLDFYHVVVAAIAMHQLSLLEADRWPISYFTCCKCRHPLVFYALLCLRQYQSTRHLTTGVHSTWAARQDRRQSKAGSCAQKSDANAQASSTHLLLAPEQHGCECGNDFARRWQDLP